MPVKIVVALTDPLGDGHNEHYLAFPDGMDAASQHAEFSTYSRAWHQRRVAAWDAWRKDQSQATPVDEGPRPSFAAWLRERGAVDTTSDQLEVFDDD